MRFSRWRPLYEEILDDLGYDVRTDTEGARLLDSLLPESGGALERISRRIAGRRVVVAGGALGDDDDVPRGPVLAAGDSVPLLLSKNIVPSVVLTDLDKDVDAQLEACRRGAVAVIHAHGDNMDLLSRFVPLFPPPVLGTCQCEPFGNLVNFGGFTDGDRAVFMARELGASGCVLAGFDFEDARGVKLKKLAWAKRLIALHGDFVEFAR